MKVWSDSFDDNGPIPTRCAFGKQDPGSHVALSGNRSPHLAWSGLPEGTPSLGDDVNQEGHTVPATLPRVDFFHWVLVELDPATQSVAEGAFSDGVTSRGKDGPSGPAGTRQGINNYTDWFAGDADMGGDYYGYDGPCPPWNDEIVHHYVFTVYALDVARVAVQGRFGGTAVLAAIEDHVLGSASLTGTYSLNPAVG